MVQSKARPGGRLSLVAAAMTLVVTVQRLAMGAELYPESTPTTGAYLALAAELVTMAVLASLAWRVLAERPSDPPPP